jgi:hypothetical protein
MNKVRLIELTESYPWLVVQHDSPVVFFLNQQNFEEWTTARGRGDAAVRSGFTRDWQHETIQACVVKNTQSLRQTPVDDEVPSNE